MVFVFKDPVKESNTAPSAPNQGTPKGTGPKASGRKKALRLRKNTRASIRITERYTGAMVKTVLRSIAAKSNYGHHSQKPCPKGSGASSAIILAGVLLVAQKISDR